MYLRKWFIQRANIKHLHTTSLYLSFLIYIFHLACKFVYMALCQVLMNDLPQRNFLPFECYELTGKICINLWKSICNSLILVLAISKHLFTIHKNLLLNSCRRKMTKYSDTKTANFVPSCLHPLMSQQCIMLLGC